MHALDRLDLVEDDEESAAAGLVQDCEQSAEEAGAAVVEVTLDLGAPVTGGPADGGDTRRLRGRQRRWPQVGRALGILRFPD